MTRLQKLRKLFNSPDIWQRIREWSFRYMIWLIAMRRQAKNIVRAKYFISLVKGVTRALYLKNTRKVTSRQAAEMRKK